MCLGCLCDVGFGGVVFLVIVGLLVRGVSEGIAEGRVGRVVENLG